MEGMHLRDRKSFVNNYINPNLSEGFIAMLYPEIPNHPMQSYYLTNKGREFIRQESRILTRVPAPFHSRVF
jgi:ATP-dependent DNA helicase RecG